MKKLLCLLLACLLLVPAVSSSKGESPSEINVTHAFDSQGEH